MNKIKLITCSLTLASLLIFSTQPINVFADENETVTTETRVENEDGSVSETITITSGDTSLIDANVTEGTQTSVDGNTTTTTTTTVNTETDANGSTTKNIEEQIVNITAGISSTAPLTITMPANIVHPEKGEYTINFTVNYNGSLDDVEVRMIKGEKSISDWDSATPCGKSSITIPEEQSDSWYTVIAKDKNASWAIARVYAHCEKKPETTSEPIIVPPTDNTCPEGYVLKDGQCYKESPSCPDGYTLNANGECIACPDGYQLDSTGNCVKIPQVTTNNTCPEGKYMNENGECVDKIVSLPQTGGFDGLMMFFIFGIGIAACGFGVIAYAKRKENSPEDIDELDNVDDEDDDEE